MIWGALSALQSSISGLYAEQAQSIYSCSRAAAFVIKLTLLGVLTELKSYYKNNIFFS